jgi:hypothetical protein
MGAARTLMYDRKLRFDSALTAVVLQEYYCCIHFMVNPKVLLRCSPDSKNTSNWTAVLQLFQNTSNWTAAKQGAPAMALKYQKPFTIPEVFFEVLKSLTREVLRSQVRAGETGVKHRQRPSKSGKYMQPMSW